MNAVLPVPGDVLCRAYVVEAIVGQGGMGVVLRARHTVNGQRVAFKVLTPEAVAHPEAVPRFLNEAKATNQLRSDHVVKVFDAGTLESGLPFMMMELLEGEDLRAVIERPVRPSIPEIVGWLLQAAEAI